MSTELDALYQEIILDHNRRPRNWGELPGASGHAAGRNPLCGDEVSLWVKLDGDVIADVRFTGQGCAISKASASLLTDAVKGKTREEAEALFTKLHALVTGEGAPVEPSEVGAMRALSGVRKFPVRVKCASMAWHTMRKALADAGSAAAAASGAPSSDPAS